MSKHETWRTKLYWESVGGLLIEEFMSIKGNKDQGKRPVDGLIILGEKKGIFKGNTYDISGKDVIVIQTKRGRIGMYLLGQAYFSRFLIEKHKPKSVKSVAICGRNDKVMQELADQHDVEIVVIEENKKKQ
tara:strand:+ start:590 stop:982 length:393 start_codon:yes stop_codon:yes gene_type:complete